MEEHTQETQIEANQFKRWFQDNLRIIISVAIVVLIAGGIYSYSKRTDAPVVSGTSTENTADSNTSSSDQTDASSDNSKQAVTAPASQETESSFVETAGKGESLTVLARRATANYLEKNPDSSLTKEHKIYIEDYLRKNAKKTPVRVGSSVEFSKDLIQKAIGASKNLNERQLNNLKKFSARVSSLQ
ncbi:MAG TPA: hypothetical protein VF817_00285 [Patescibacteria group bacterium]